jgi:hypothetical protein
MSRKNDEIRMTKLDGMTKSAESHLLAYSGTPIRFRASSIRHSCFVICKSPFRCAKKFSTRSARSGVADACRASADFAKQEHRETSGRQDLNLRPVAAATALHECIEIVATASGFVIKFSLYRFTTGCETFAVNQDPGNAVLGCFHLTGIVTIEIGATGFEPATSWSQTTRSTKLSYAPMNG